MIDTSTIGTPQGLSRKEREKLARRQEIIAAARVVFARKGFADATLDDVAELAEFGKGTLYNYFESKEALFDSVLQDSFDQFVSIAHETLGAEGEFRDRIENFVRSELGFLFRQPEGLCLMLRETLQMRTDVANPMMQLLPQLLSALGDTIAAEQRRRKVIAGVPVELATILINMLFGQFSARYYGGLCGARQDPKRPVPCSPTEMFAQLSDEEIQREVDTATKLIMTVYFTGITR